MSEPLIVFWVPLCFPCYAGLCGECDGAPCTHDCEAKSVADVEERSRYESTRAAVEERRRLECSAMQSALHDPGVW